MQVVVGDQTAPGEHAIRQDGGMPPALTPEKADTGKIEG